jgi:hypothetical protein
VEPEAQDVPAEFPAVTGRAAERSLRAARVREAAVGEDKHTAEEMAVPDQEVMAAMEVIRLVCLTALKQAEAAVEEAQARYTKEPTEMARREKMAIAKAAQREKCLCCLTAIAL